MKFDEITVTFQPSKPSKPIIIITEKKQLLIGTIIQISFLKTNQSVAIINNRTPKPKTTISFLMYDIMSSAIIGMPPKWILLFLLKSLIISLISKIFSWFFFFSLSLYFSNSYLFVNFLLGSFDFR